MTGDPDNGSKDRLSEQDSDLTYEIDDDELPSQAVVRAVATLTDTPILDLEPLYHVLDPDHLDGLIEGAEDNTRFYESSVTIDFNGCRVTVTEDAVHVRECECD